MTFVTLRMRSASTFLFDRLTARHFSKNAESSAYASSFRSRVRSATHPSPTVSSSSRARSGLASRMKRRGVTPFVTLWKRSGHNCAKSRSTVCVRSSECSVATDGRQVGHAHLFLACLVNDRHPHHTRLVTGILLPHLVEKPAVNLVDDLERTRQQPAKKR